MARRPQAPVPRGSKLVLALAAVGLFGAGLYLGWVVTRPPPPPDFGPVAGPAGAPSAGSPTEVPPTEVPGTTSPPTEVPPTEVPGTTSGRPRIAIIVDDLGRRPEDLDDLAGLGIPLTYSVLPYESRTPEIVAELRRRGAEYLCHLPMEAKGDANPGPGALLLSMSRDELAAATQRALAAVAGAAGANNHMGSGISSSRPAITAVLEVLGREHLFYIDSRTSTDTLGFTVARQLGIPAAERQVFLDSERDVERIRDQFAHLLELAAERGAAIAIAHPYPETLEVLAQEVGGAVRRGFEFVEASSLLISARAPGGRTSP